MYLSEKPRPIDLADREMMIEVVSNETLAPHHPHHHPHPHPHPHHQPHHHPPHQMILGDSSGGDEEPEPEHPEHPEPKAPKKRAETWIAEETRSLISFRREVDSLFNTSKSNKHLWEQISSKMREKGFDRSPTMCTDKWRNLLKEFKKARHQQDKGGGNSNSGNGKMSYYKELEELLRSRNRNSSSNSNSNNNGNNNVSGGGYHQNSTQGHAKVDAFIQFSDKGFDDASIQFGPIEAGGRSTVNLERRLEHDGDPLAITATDTVAPNGVPPWNWRDTGANGEDPSNYGGKVISIKLGEYTRRIGIDGTADAIKEAIKSAFRLRTKRAFWLEDENNVIRSLDRDMPIGNYTLHLDEGITIKICLYDSPDRMHVTEEKTLYTEDDFRDFLSRRGWIGLREVNSYRSIDCLDDLHSGAMYEGVRLLGE